MKLSVKGLTLGFGILWGGCFLVVGLCNLAWNDYGLAFLQVLASIYPGYHSVSSFSQVVVGTLYALVDGSIGGAVFALLYNFFSGRETA